MTENMTDAERCAAAGGHPVGDCEDCGKFHTPWSLHFNDDGSARTAADDLILVTGERPLTLHDVTGDPEHGRLSAALKVAACCLGLPPHDVADMVQAAAYALDMRAGDFAAVLGLALEEADGYARVAVPDGERACYAGECPHEDGYVPLF